MKALRAYPTHRGRIRWTCKSFRELSVAELYEIVRLRIAVFVVEQKCCYQDADGLDQCSWHLMGRTRSKTLVAYVRIILPGKKFAEPTLGRLLVDRNFRTKGLARRLIENAIGVAEKMYPRLGIRASAQAYLRDSYKLFGFNPVGKSYLEDGIPHFEIYRPPRDA